MRRLMLVGVALTIGVALCQIAHAGSDSRSIAGQNFTVSFNPTTGQVLVTISGAGNSITSVSRSGQDITAFDARKGQNEGGEFECLDTYLKDHSGDNPPVQRNYVIEFKIGQSDHTANVTIKSDGTVQITSVT